MNHHTNNCVGRSFSLYTLFAVSCSNAPCLPLYRTPFPIWPLTGSPDTVQSAVFVTTLCIGIKMSTFTTTDLFLPTLSLHAGHVSSPLPLSTMSCSHSAAVWALFSYEMAAFPFNFL